MTEELYKRIWQLSPNVQQQDAFTELTELTKQLIDVYAEQGRLDRNPFEPSLGRKINLPFTPYQSTITKQRLHCNRRFGLCRNDSCKRIAKV